MYGLTGKRTLKAKNIIFYLNSSIFQVILDNYDNEKMYFLSFQNQIINRSICYYLAVNGIIGSLL